MSKPKREKRTFNGMSYRDVQRRNSLDRAKLSREDQSWLKTHRYKNTGWNSVIALHEKIEAFLERDKLAARSLEDLFLEVDRIGNKYQSQQEINEFHQKLTKELNELAELVDQQFPDTEAEVIDFSNEPRRKNSRTVRI